MQQLAESAPSPNSSSFAGLLAALTAPAAAKPGSARPANEWSDDGLADDVATLSYERALQTHARYRRPDPPDWAPPNSAVPYSAFTKPAARPNQAPADTSVADTSVFEPLVNRASGEQSAPAANAQQLSAREKVNAAADERDRKSASITIRMSPAECAQLRRRAAEAGLTISSYLRSCTFEAESLRAQVKEALAELRSAASQETRVASAAVRRSRPGWLLRLLPRRHVCPSGAELGARNGSRRSCC